MRIGICDDDYFIYEQLNDFILSALAEMEIYEEPEIVYYASGEELFEGYSGRGWLDFLFLDISMQRLDGITVGKLVRELDEKLILIFVSSHQERAIDSFDCRAFHFLTKPLQYSRFQQVFYSAFDLYRTSNAKYLIQFRNEWARIPISDIKYVELVHRRMLFHTLSGEYEMSGTLREVAEDLAPYGFVQSHQGYVVNMEFIRRFSKTELVMDDGATVPISLHRRTEMVLAYKGFLERQ